MQNLKSMHGHAISLYRAVFGLLFACHGAATLFGVFGGAVGSRGGTLSPLDWPGGTAALIELVGGVFVLVGLATRTSAVVSSGSMAYAYFTVHVSHGLLPIQNGGELAVLFCWGLLMVAILGPGPLSLDAAIGRLRAPGTTTTALRAETQES
ncbi:DoxX family protein [Actinospica robiniae]|uniref:DoxX family protein n=1 Tax=Actinospica robiniae TaxID=304901 RepID=UPI000414ED1F|nr:DoxX family protein [Actinospica robiniae]